MRRITEIVSILGRWGLDHPAPTTHENCIFAWPGIGHPSAEGNFVPRRNESQQPYSAAEKNLGRGSAGAAVLSVVKGNLDRDGNVPSSPPLEGWAKPGVVRECGISHLVP